MLLLIRISVEPVVDVTYKANLLAVVEVTILDCNPLHRTKHSLIVSPITLVTCKR